MKTIVALLTLASGIWAMLHGVAPKWMMLIILFGQAGPELLGWLLWVPVEGPKGRVWLRHKVASDAAQVQRQVCIVQQIDRLTPEQRAQVLKWT